MPHNARFIIMSGPAAAGKTTIAKKLAAEFDLPHLSKDTIKSAIIQEIDFNIVPVSQIGNAAVSVLLTLASQMPKGAIIDNVWRGNQADGLRCIPGRHVELFCSCDRAILEKRYSSRIRPVGYVPEHSSKEELWSSETIKPIGNAPLIKIDTEYSVDFRILVNEIKRLWLM